ncbi:MAG: hypothetical protein ACI85O_003048, partial [Saprospiraceae bacterium]
VTILNRVSQYIITIFRYVFLTYLQYAKLCKENFHSDRTEIRGFKPNSETNKKLLR